MSDIANLQGGAPTPATLTTNIATCNVSNQMLTSNASGNLITPVYDASRDTVNDGKNNYLYDAEGRVCAAQSLLSGVITGYLYDAGGNRVAKGTLSTLSCDLTLGSQTPTPLPNNGFTLTSQYLFGPGGEQMTELNATGAWVHTNVTANGTLFASFDNDGKGVHFFLDDWLGTRRVQTNYLGAVENTWTSLPYGDALTPSGTDDPTEQHFTGKERDAESGLDYFGARYYASSMGRWMSPDWANKPEAIPYSELRDPQSFDLYVYVRNNALGRNDPDGHQCPGCPPDPHERVIQGATGAANVYVGVQKVGAAGAAGVSSVVDGPIGIGLAVYGGISGVGQVVTGLIQVGGAATGKTEAAEKAANAVTATTTISGVITTLATGSTDKGAAAASVEAVVTPSATREIFKDAASMLDTALGIKDLILGGKKPEPVAPTPPPPAAPPPPPPPSKKQ